MNPNYDSIASSYDRRYQENDYAGVEEALMAFVGQDLTGRVLEVGCGTGHWLRLLDESGIRVAGVDASANMLTYAHAQARGAALVHGRAEQLPWASEAFQRIFCINALHHFEDKVGFLAEARRVLAPGGQIMTVGLDPHGGVDRWYIYEYFEPVLEIDKRRYPASSHIRDWMHGLQFMAVHTLEVQHLPARLSARAAMEQGASRQGRDVPACGSHRRRLSARRRSDQQGTRVGRGAGRIVVPESRSAIARNVWFGAVLVDTERKAASNSRLHLTVAGER